MRYKLIGSNDTSNILKTVLNNRGIDDYERYLHLNKCSRDSYKTLEHINLAVETFDKHFMKKSPILILQDTDVDGITSSVIIYKMIKALDANYPVSIAVHKQNKAHGLQDFDFSLSDDIKLLIVPDAGTNDVEQHKMLYAKGIDCICLDHHQVSEDISDSPAVIVNNQIGDSYKNKNCSGAFIALEFCRALDELYWTEYADNYLDLCAIGNIADVMSLKSFETRALVNEGLSNVTNKMLLEIIKIQEFSMKGIVSPFTVSFYVAPLINAYLRSASFEERELLSRAFCEDDSEMFEYTKRGAVFPTEENIYEHCARLMKSFKNKQDSMKKKILKILLADTAQYENNKVPIIVAPDDIDRAFLGVIVIKFSETINKPVLMVKKTDLGFEGSGRAYNYCPIEDFRELVSKCPYTLYSEGHPSAFGVGLSDIDKAIKWFNQKLDGISFDKTYLVDFVVPASSINEAWCGELENNKSVFAHEVDEPLWCITDLCVSNSNAKIVGSESNVIQIYDNETNIKYVKFKCDEDDKLKHWLINNDSNVSITVVGTLGLNEYNGTCSPQIIIQDYIIKE